MQPLCRLWSIKKGVVTVSHSSVLSMESAVVFLEFTLHIHNMFITWAQTLQLPSANEEKICQYLYGPCSHK